MSLNQENAHDTVTTIKVADVSQTWRNQPRYWGGPPRSADADKWLELHMASGIPKRPLDVLPALVPRAVNMMRSHTHDHIMLYAKAWFQI